MLKINLGFCLKEINVVFYLVTERLTRCLGHCEAFRDCSVQFFYSILLKNTQKITIYKQWGVFQEQVNMKEKDGCKLRTEKMKKENIE